MQAHNNHTESSKFWRSPGVVAATMVLLIVGFYMLREHWSHVAGLWPYLLLLVCPLMHLFHKHR